HQDNAPDNTDHAQGHPENRQYELTKKEEEKCQEHGVEARAASDPAVILVILAFQQYQKDRQGLQRINDRQPRGEHANKPCHLLMHHACFPIPTVDNRACRDSVPDIDVRGCTLLSILEVDMLKSRSVTLPFSAIAFVSPPRCPVSLEQGALDELRED